MNKKEEKKKEVKQKDDIVRKVLSEDEAKTGSVELKRFSFPTHGLSIEAKDYAGALKKLNELIK